jgi:hypothetical protein
MSDKFSQRLIALIKDKRKRRELLKDYLPKNYSDNDDEELP